MNEGTNMDRLKAVLEQHIRRQLPSGATEWGIVTSVDWEDRSCVVKGLLDELEYYDVSLGIRDIIIKPAIGAKCLIGAIANESTDTYLIDVEAFEEMIFISGHTELHITKSGFTVKRGTEDLKEILMETFDQLKNAIITTPSGPGKFSPDDKLKFEELKNKVLNLFK